MSSQPLIAIVGPTATGKSRLALSLALVLGGEIVNADSRQVYRCLDIGTAKPSPQDRALAPHHLLDIIAPDEPFNVAMYVDLARPAIEAVRARGKAPLLVGGSGLYVWTLLEGRGLPRIAPDAALRRSLEEKASTLGAAALHEELRRLDPAAAGRIHANNVRRVVRAMEVCLSGGGTFSAQSAGPGPDPSGLIVIGLSLGRDELYRRIDRRVDAMVSMGLVEEVKGLVEKGYGFDLPAMSSLGYRQICCYLRGEVDLSAAVQRIKYETHRYARQQNNWFRQSDSRITWFDANTEANKIVEYVKRHD